MDCLYNCIIEQDGIVEWDTVHGGLQYQLWLDSVETIVWLFQYPGLHQSNHQLHQIEP